MIDWMKYTLLQIKRNINFWILLTLIIVAVCLYQFFDIKLELIALIFSPLFTLSILPMIEESKSKWQTKYETFKYLYANRDNLINYTVVQHFNLIDIVFINDKKVRKCWKELRQLLNSQSTLSQQNAKCAELMATMANVLGLDKDMTFSDIACAYYPVGLANIDTIADKRANLEVQFYEKACSFIDNQLKDSLEKEQ